MLSAAYLSIKYPIPEVEIIEPNNEKYLIREVKRKPVFHS